MLQCQFNCFLAVGGFRAEVVIFFILKNRAQRLQDYWTVVRYKNGLGHIAPANRRGLIDLGLT